MKAALDESPSKGQSRLAALRAQLAEKFPEAPVRTCHRWETGCPALDQTGGLRRGSVTEVCGSAAGSQLLLAALLTAASHQGFWMGLIDAANAFEPADWPEAHLERLLWVQGGNAEKSLKAADLLLRDGNLSVLALDLQVVPIRQLQRIPASTWHRFQRVIEESSTVFVIFTPGPLVEGAPCRIATRFAASLGSLQRTRPTLLDQIQLQIFERGQENFALRISA